MIAIRPAEAADAAAIAAIYAPFVLSGTVSFENEAPDARAMRSRMGSSDGFYPWLVATNGDGVSSGVVGYAYAGRFRDRPAYHWTVETSIYLAGDAQQRGVGRLLYEALLDTLRAQGFVHAIGAIALPNDASIKLHEQVGFRRAGVIREAGYKFGRWIDIGFWQCELAEAASPPREVRPFSEVGLVRD
ncbi:GNAT family N-acetyltransferase [Sphingomonas sp. Y38-1Y]|uniref:GNAT family N-acetyltransferase n=1 Tax=Sphingomonas sp. Y38-1Y TaxID=3078265 RepID=UPI0028ED6106|nr:GNAT family N-acetyltransferase [Sphingomonas sp. Y38-1Y]